MKRILLVTQYFYPENFKSNDIAFELKKRGYDVTVLASIPNYPQGEYYNGYGIFKKRIEVINGVKVYRVYQSARGKKHSNIKLSLNYITYAFFSVFWALWLAIFKQKFDSIIIHQTSPITQALPAIIISKIRRIPIYIWVLDIWPDAMSSGGGIKNKRILSIIDGFVQWVYRNSEKILISSEGFEELVNRKADYSSKIVYFPNWCDDLFSMKKIYISPLPKGFRVMMAGNLGTAQDIKNVMKTVLLLKENKNIQWIFVGDGSERSYMENFVKENNLNDIVTLTGKRPFEEMPSYFSQADVMLLTLRAEFPHLRAVVPARLQSYMSAGKPIAGMIDGGGAAVIEKSKCGLCASAGDYHQLAKNIKWMSENLSDIVKMGQSGRLYFESEFEKEYCINRLENIINK